MTLNSWVLPLVLLYTCMSSSLLQKWNAAVNMKWIVVALMLLLKMKNEFDWIWGWMNWLVDRWKQRKEEHRNGHEERDEPHSHRNSRYSSRHSSVRDDEDGHLIYQHGDWLQNRCTYLNSISLTLYICSLLLSSSLL